MEEAPSALERPGTHCACPEEAADTRRDMMKKFIRVLDAVIDTDWLISSILTKDSTCLKIRQSPELTLEFTGTPDELKAAQEAIWNQVKDMDKKEEE